MARNKYPEETVKRIVEEAKKLFVANGYDNTSIQEIINHLGGLSKGAIYHHFKSKEEIFTAVCESIGQENIVFYDQIRDAPDKSGYEKLKLLFKGACLNPNNTTLMAMASKILSDPKFVLNEFMEIYELVAPVYIRPILEQGIRDGSIQTAHPKELSEVIATLTNVWLNPLLAKATPEEMRGKMEFFDLLLKGLGIEILDDEIILQYIRYSELSRL